jgi:hypothetical protein
VAELALDDDERYAFVGHFDDVSVPELMWGEASPNARCDGHCAAARFGRRHSTTGDHASGH